jgi:recombination protein RecR
MTKNFLTLVSALKKMPGVTNKQATNIAYYLILNPSTLTHELINKISEAKKNIKTCQQCNCLIDEKTYCDICTNPNRDQHTLCIVANHDDLNKIENTKSFTGLYYIVHQLKNQEKQIDLIKLLQLITTKNISDVIIAFD